VFNVPEFRHHRYNIIVPAERELLNHEYGSEAPSARRKDFLPFAPFASDPCEDMLYSIALIVVSTTLVIESADLIYHYSLLRIENETFIIFDNKKNRSNTS
jgi:hypothetical protein